jgi:hypothetical protein
LIVVHAGSLAEERWWRDELGRTGNPLDQSRGDAHALDFILGRFPRQHTATIARETRLMAIALLDDHWEGVKRLVEALCRRSLPIRLSGRAVERVVVRSHEFFRPTSRQGLRVME